MTKEVEGEFRLGKQLVPKEVGEGTGEAGEDAEEVDFEGSGGTLRRRCVNGRQEALVGRCSSIPR